MLSSIRIRCVTKDDRYHAYERITHIGGIALDGSRWRMSQPEALEVIAAGPHQFWVMVGGAPQWVLAATSGLGFKYLKSESDGDEPHDLFRLPDCTYTLMCAPPPKSTNPAQHFSNPCLSLWPHT